MGNVCIHEFMVTKGIDSEPLWLFMQQFKIATPMIVELMGKFPWHSMFRSSKLCVHTHSCMDSGLLSFYFLDKICLVYLS